MLANLLGRALMVAYVPCFPLLYVHMIQQRRKVLGAADCGSKPKVYTKEE